MDGKQFDDLARVLARGTSRRKVLKGLFGGALGGSLAATGVLRAGRASADPTTTTTTAAPTTTTTTTAAPTTTTTTTAAPTCVALGDTCSDEDTCCDGSCNQGTCNCGDPARPQHLCPCVVGTANPCGTDASLVCCASGSQPGSGGVCTSASVGCEPTCGDTGATCSKPDDCCDTLTCANGSCQAIQCSAPGGQCQADKDCCQGQCSDQGVCYCTDPARPIIGCACTTGTQSPCGDTTANCCPTTNTVGGPGICTSGMAECPPVQCSDPGGACSADKDCCQGKCSDQGVCYCTDPARPIIGCACTTGTQSPCGDSTAICCPTTNRVGGPGICTSSMAECQPVHCSYAGDACSADKDCCQGKCSQDGVCYCTDPARPALGCTCATGTENPCGDANLLCCASSDLPGGKGICTASSVGCGQPGPTTTTTTTTTPTTTTTAPPSTTVTSLPNTGSGSRDGNAGGFLTSAALIGGGAAILGHRLRKLRSETEAASDTDES